MNVSKKGRKTGTLHLYRDGSPSRPLHMWFSMLVPGCKRLIEIDERSLDLPVCRILHDDNGVGVDISVENTSYVV